MSMSKEQEEMMATMGARRGQPIGPNVDHYYVEHPNVHWKRRKDILKAHPDVQQLQGYDSTSQLYSIILVVTQLLLIASVSYLNLGVLSIVALSFLFGAFIDHALWVLIHDFGHGLGASTLARNTAWVIISNSMHVWPSGVAFRFFHNKHHGQMHLLESDPDLADEMEQRIFGHSMVGKVMWLVFFPFIQAIRVMSTYTPPPFDLALVMNWVVALSVDVFVLYFFGVKAFAYMILSSMLSVGFHPVGGRWIAEHFSIDAPQETYSTYGNINKVILNVGYHNEHHDFPTVPWRRLPKIRAKAPEFYDFLTYHTSYVKLLIAFITNPGFSLNTRVVRAKKSKAN